MSARIDVCAEDYCARAASVNWHPSSSCAYKRRGETRRTKAVQEQVGISASDENSTEAGKVELLGLLRRAANLDLRYTATCEDRMDPFNESRLARILRGKWEI